MERLMERIGVSIDFYGTLVELDHDVPSIAQELTKLGFPCSTDVEDIWNSKGFDGQQTHDASQESYEEWREGSIAKLAILCGVPNGMAREISRQLIALDRTWTVRARSGAVELLNTIGELRVPYCILTNWDYPLAPYLIQAKLSTAIPAITSATVGYRKPAKEPFEKARVLMDIKASEHIHIGDNWGSDVVGVIRSGGYAVWISDAASQKLPPGRIIQTPLADAAKVVTTLANRLRAR